MPWSDAQVRSALGLGGGEEAEYSSISTDTRTIEAGALFVALRGDRFDGHDHLAKAAEAGATGAMVLGTLLDELERRNLATGLCTLCIGGGMGTATIIERV